jgi:hypothetical protein
VSSRRFRGRYEKGGWHTRTRSPPPEAPLRLTGSPRIRQSPHAAGIVLRYVAAGNVFSPKKQKVVDMIARRTYLMTLSNRTMLPHGRPLPWPTKTGRIINVWCVRIRDNSTNLVCSEPSMSLNRLLNHFTEISLSGASQSFPGNGWLVDATSQDPVPVQQLSPCGVLQKAEYKVGGTRGTQTRLSGATQCGNHSHLQYVDRLPHFPCADTQVDGRQAHCVTDQGSALGVCNTAAQQTRQPVPVAGNTR